MRPWRIQTRGTEGPHLIQEYLTRLERLVLLGLEEMECEASATPSGSFLLNFGRLD